MLVPYYKMNPNKNVSADISKILGFQCYILCPTLFCKRDVIDHTVYTLFENVCKLIQEICLKTNIITSSSQQRLPESGILL